MRYILVLVLILFGANSFAIEPPISPTTIRDLSVRQKVELVEKLKQIEKLAFEINEESNSYIGVSVSYKLDSDREYLEDFYEIYEQVQTETTMAKVLDIRDPFENKKFKVNLSAEERKRVPSSQHKYMYGGGYQFDMMDSGGELGKYTIIEGRECFGKSFYLVKTPDEEEIIMQESEITNWQYIKK